MNTSKNQDAAKFNALVKNMKECSGITGVPSNFCFSADGQKLFFLASTGDAGNEIHYVDISEEDWKDTSSQLKWKVLLNPADTQGNGAPLPKEELLRRERMRATLGLASFIYSPSNDKILIPQSPHLFVASKVQEILSSSNGQSSSLNTVELVSKAEGARLDAKLSEDGTFVSFIRDNNIWVQHVETQEEVLVTKIKPEDKSKGSGIAEYIMQEEFDRYTGYWWSSIVEQLSPSKTLRRILFVNVDESALPIFHITNPGLKGTSDAMIYPAPGDPNARVSISIAEIIHDKSLLATNSVQVTLKHLNPTLKQRFDFLEYIPRLGWLPDGKSVWIQLLDRKQQYMALVTIDIQQFVASETEPSDSELWDKHSRSSSQSVSPGCNKDDSTASTNSSTPVPGSSNNCNTKGNHNCCRPQFKPSEGVCLVHEEYTPDYWINITNLIYWFQDGSRRLILASELSNPSDQNKTRHLYLLTPKVSNGGNSNNNQDGYIQYSRQAITIGESWQVDDSFLRVDEKKLKVFFMGTKDSPLECHLYVSSFAPKGLSEPNKNVQRLSPSGCTHQIDMNRDMTAFVSCFSNVKDVHRIQIFSLEYHDEGSAVEMMPFPSLHSTLARPITLKQPDFDVIPPELFNFVNSSGETIYGCYFKPKNFDPSKKYPTILRVYGGPHVQLVCNDFKITRMNLVYQMYASLGYLVVMMDGVGSWRRGLKFEGYLRCAMGTKEVQEQVEGLTYLIKSGIVDPERIAVQGWSYGGYLSLLCLAQRPDFFKLAISGAPVTLWEGYDTGYTERYMDTPQNAAQAYQLGSVMNYVQTLPDDPNRLMLIHGILDENVHVCHTLELIQKLIEHEKPYQLQVFPQERHGVRNPASSIYNERTILRFISDHL